jgi:hypothetical protein
MAYNSSWWNLKTYFRGFCNSRKNRRCGGTCLFYLQSESASLLLTLSLLADFSTLKMEATRSYETSGLTRLTRRYIPEDGIFYINLKSYIYNCCLWYGVSLVVHRLYGNPFGIERPSVPEHWASGASKTFLPRYQTIRRQYTEHHNPYLLCRGHLRSRSFCRQQTVTGAVLTQMGTVHSLTPWHWFFHQLPVLPCALLLTDTLYRPMHSSLTHVLLVTFRLIWST